MDRAFQRYVRHHRAEGHTPKTIQYHRDNLEWSPFPFLVAAGHGLGLDALTVDTILDWVDDQRGRGLAEKTVATRVISVKGFSRWLAAEGWLPKDPLARFKFPKVDDKPKSTLSPDEVEALIRACDRRT